ncbi:MAG: hypothetical protein AB8I08_16265 [Sandaracinaceae bacterium]
MAEQLDRIDAPDTRRYVISLEALTGGRLAMLPGVEAIRLVTSSLEPALHAAGHEARLGKIVSSRASCEAGLFFDRGFAEGAVVSLACEPVATEVNIVVGRSSRLLRGLVWSGLIGGCVLGLLIAATLFPEDMDGRLKLIFGLLFGASVGVASLAAGPRVAFLAGGASSELADALNDVVVDCIDGAAPKKKRKRRRKKSARE